MLSRLYIVGFFSLVILVEAQCDTSVRQGCIHDPWFLNRISGLVGAMEEENSSPTARTKNR